MKNFLLTLTCVLALVAASIAQTNATKNQSSLYANWVAHSTNSISSGTATIVPDFCYMNASQASGSSTVAGHQFFPFATNVAVTIIDGSNTETVTPSSVVAPTSTVGPALGPFNCSFTASFSNAHPAGVAILSGDAGVGEAANDNGSAYGVFRGVDIIQGTCTGTATASATLGLFGPDTTTTKTCGATSPAAGKVLDRSVTVKNLSCTASAAGVNASSGVVTVLKAHQGADASTALTCTFGTATSCSDTTHTFNAVAGDIVGIQFTSQAGETLANVACSFQAF